MTHIEKEEIISEVINRVIEAIKQKEAIIDAKVNETENRLMKASLLHQIIGHQEAEIAAIDVKLKMLKEINAKQEAELKKMIEKAMN